MLRRFPHRPSWVLPGAIFDLDYRRNRYWGGSVYLGQAGGNGQRGSLITGGPASAVANTLFCPDENGIYRTFPLTSPRITMGRGLWAEQSTTNYAWWSRDFTQAAWVKNGITPSKTALGADLTLNGGSVLTATTNDATVLQSATVPSRLLVTSCLVRRKTGSGPIYMTQDNGATWTDITSQMGAAGGIYLLCQVPSQTLANPIFGFKIGTSGDEIEVDLFQNESTTTGYPTTRIATVGATRTRGANDMPAYGTDASSYNDGVRIVLDTFFNTAMSCLAIYSGAGVPAHVVKGGGTNAVTRMTGGADGSHVSFGSAGVVATTSNDGFSAGPNGCTGLGPINKAVGRLDGFGAAVCLNGGPIAREPTAQITNLTDLFPHIGIGNKGDGGLALGGYMARQTFWPVGITDGLMTHYATPGTVDGL